MRQALMAVVLLFAGGRAEADTVMLTVARDNTLYQSSLGDISNGAGAHIFAGRTVDGLIRRGLIYFDVASVVPSDAVVMNVQLQLTLTRSVQAGPVPVSLHRLLRDWGEGASTGIGEEGGGAAAEPGDATWIHAFHRTQTWTNPGGDFAPAASAVLVVAGELSHIWSSPSLVEDVQAWSDDPTSNFGWIVIGDESTTTTAKRFGAREGGNGATLTIDYVPTVPVIPATWAGIKALTRH